MDHEIYRNDKYILSLRMKYDVGSGTDIQK